MSAGLASHPTISVILPVYNAERYVAQAVESILNQTFRDFELILIDDGSTDGSLEILRRYAERDSRIVLINRENRGLVASLNEGIDLARGQWIARMDADDISMPQRFERQLQWLIQTGADICGSWVQCFGARKTFWRYPVSHEACEAQLLFDVPFAHPVVIGRAELFSTLRYDESFQNAEDYDLWQRAWVTGYRFSNVPETLLHYRVHSKQVSSLSRRQQKYLAQSIRKRHWLALAENENNYVIESILSALENGDADLKIMMPAFSTLRARYSGEAATVFLFNAFRVFCKAAANTPGPGRLWHSLIVHGKGTGFLKQLIVLTVLRTFRIRPNAKVFGALKSFYLR